MNHALIIGDTGGIGRALSARLQSAGWQIDGLSRSATGFDLTKPDVVEAHLSALGGPYDLIFIATGGLEIHGVGPEKSMQAVSAQALANQFALNAIGPALVLRHAARLLAKNRRSVIAALSARVGSISDNRLGGWTSYRASKAALNQIVKCSAIELARSHKQAICVALHPGTVATNLTKTYAGRYPTVSAPEAAESLLQVIFGLTVNQTGQFYDWQGKRIEW